MGMKQEKKLRKAEGRIDEFRRRIKDADQYKVKDDVFDDSTLKGLYNMANKGILKALGGSVSTGKEANVFHAIGENDIELAIKIYRISTSNFKAMTDYIVGDPRFSSIKRDRKSLIFAWPRKEFRNLSRALEVGLPVPRPIEARRNILVMEFIGEDGVGAPKLKDVEYSLPDARELFEKVQDFMRVLYVEAGLVHSDMSEYNILIRNGEPVVIDMAQAVTPEHPNAGEFLERDIKNVVTFFSKRDVKCDESYMLEYITG